MTFAARNAPSMNFEQSLIARFCCVPGWTACPFGQALLKDDARHALRNFQDLSGNPTLIRWMPDILAWRGQLEDTDRIALVDAKTGRGDTTNHAVEIAAVDALNVYVHALNTPAFFVFSDWTVLTPRDAAQRGWKGPDPGLGRGSGTAYFLIEKRWARSFDVVFPPLDVEDTI